MKKIFSSLLLPCLIAIFLLPLVGTAAAAPESTGKQVDVLFLHDTHSHLNSFVTVEDGQDVTLGGFAHIRTLITQVKEKNPDTLILDAGDFSMGTLVQTIFHTDAPELRMLGALECDATTLGNHEFDYRSSGLAGALNAARESGDPVPAMVLCNIDWEAMEAEGLTKDQQLLRDAFAAYGMQDYIILTKGDVRIAVLGVFGEDSLACAPTCVLKFQDIKEAAARTVKKIRETEDADMIVCVSHSGTNEDPAKSEDELLAKAVPEIDLIISGHSHTTLEQPLLYGSTYIVSCGSYARNLGSLSMSQTLDGRWTMENYDLIPITDAITPDRLAQEKIDSIMEKVDSSYLSHFGYTREQVLAQNTVKFSTSEDLYSLHEEHNLGNLLADAFAYTVNHADTPDNHPVDVAIVPSGCVRDTFVTGDITVEDVFNAYSLGIGADGIPGYPLISIYLTGEELKTGAEIDASVSDFMPSARLYLSGIHFSFNPNRLILNKVTDCYMTGEEGNRIEIEDNRLYRVVCDLYSGQMLGAVTDVSYGILSVQPKFADGTPIEDIEDAIITSDGREVKAWAAVAGYLDSLEDKDGDGISDIPEYYAGTQGRKIIEDSKALSDLVKHPNRFTFIILGMMLLVLILAALLIVFIVKLVKRVMRRRKN
ncbi:MAG: bifunctional metallophosphatase/5'-nucleotidase [Lachnospiraceae bacterium]|nr:bifunctional UDP-sugar hydrolase/5'-nucleotidase [uncultured Acetatifactor sp.]MCI8287346.1 bifunctional metallophosphatase/5'-nucleotidase [Lachnospiraceae bacterium]